MFRSSNKKSGKEEKPPEPDPRQKILIEAMADLSATLDLDEVLDRILARSLDLSEAERALLLLSDPNGGLRARLARGMGGTVIQPEEVSFSSTMVRRALKEGVPVSEEVGSDSEALAASQSVFELKLRSVLCAPMMFRQEILGALYMDSKVQRKTFSKEDRELFTALTRQAAIAIKNARLLREAERGARLAAELELAAEIQGDLFPDKAPTVKGVDLAGRCLPCEEISGDTYDFVSLSDGRTFVYIGDVTGHGVGPALLAAEVRGEIRALAPLESDPGALLTRVHQNLRETFDPSRFLTLFLALVDTHKNEIQYASAGHPEALLHKGGADHWLPRTGPPLGVDVEVRHETQIISGLNQGDGLLIYSDGLVEARNESGELYGTKRLSEHARRTTGTAEEIAEAVLEDVNGFSGGNRDDDRTVLVAKWQ